MRPCIRVNVLTRPPKSHGWNAPRHSAKLRSAPRSSRTTSATSSPREATRRPAINVQSRNATRAKPPTPALVPRTGYPSRGRPKRGGSGFTARGAAGLRGDDNAARPTARTTRRGHIGHSITARLFAPCSFVAPRPTFRQTCINFLGEGRATSGTPAAGRQKPRRPALSVEPSTVRALSRRSHEDTSRPSVGAPLTIISPYRQAARSFVASCRPPIWKIIVPHALPGTRNRQRRQGDTIGRRRSHRRKNHAATAPATETNRQAVRIRLREPGGHPWPPRFCVLAPSPALPAYRKNGTRQG